MSVKIYFHVVFDTFIFFSHLNIEQKDFIVHCKISYYGLWNSFHSNFYIKLTWLSVKWTLLLVLFHFKQFYFTFICDRNSRYYLRLEIPHNQRMFDESAILFIFVHCLFLKRHNSSEDDDDDAWWLWEPKGSHFSMPYDNTNAFPFLQFQFKAEVQTKFGHVLFVLIQII